MAVQPFVGDRLEKRDYISAAVVGSVFFLVYLIFSGSGVEPSLWNELCVVSGLRPPSTIVPGFWRVFAKILYAIFGLRFVTPVLNFLGSLAGGVCVALVYLIIRQILAYLVRVQDIVPWKPVAAFFAMACTVCFAAGDSMWHVVSPLKPATLRLVATLSAWYLFLRWLRVSGTWRILVIMSLSGAVASESPIGILMPFVVYFVYRIYLVAVVNDHVKVEGDVPELMSLPKWRMFYAFLGGFAFFTFLNILTFSLFGGLDACEWNALDVTINYMVRYYRLINEAATPMGWLLSVTFTVLPFIAAIVLFPVLCRDSKPVDFRVGLLLFFAGVVALMQGGILPYTELWAMSSGGVEVRSEFLEGLFSILTATTIALAGSCFRLGCENFFAYDSDEGKYVVVEKRGFVLRHVAETIMILCMLPVVLRIYRPAETKMREIVHDALVETVRECGDAKFVFTDGKLDAGLELVAAEKGSDVKPLNLMSGSSAWEKYIRTRYFDAESPDYSLAETGVPVLLRTWAGEMTNGMDHAAAQLGFEFWRRARKPVPPRSGFVARTVGIDDEESRRGAEAAKAIADRILAVSRKYPHPPVTSALRIAFSAVSWRISRFMRMGEEDQTANELDECNEAVKHMMRLVEYERMRAFMQMTPFEGLRLALARADFSEARRYGATVLQIDPDVPEANFGMGMAFLMEEKYKEAELYLERTLKRRPDEPAVLNNLSIIFRKTNRLDKALEYAKRAHEVMPDNEEIARTLKETQIAVDARKAALNTAFGR